MSASLLPAAVVLVGALIDPEWLGAPAWAQAQQALGWQKLQRRIHNPEHAQPPVPSESPSAGHERWFKHTFNYPSDMALAANSAWSDEAGGAHWRLDPVHFHLGRDRVILTEPTQDWLDLTEAQALAQTVSATFTASGWTVHCATATRWYLTEPGTQPAWQLRTPSLEHAIGQPVDACLPQGPDARRWRRILNDIQMLWHEHPVNQARLERGALPVNGVWLEGPIFPVCPPSWIDIAPACLQATACTACGPMWLDRTLWHAQQANDPQQWLTRWQTLDQTLLQPLARQQYPHPYPPKQLVLTGQRGWRSVTLPNRGPSWRDAWQCLWPRNQRRVSPHSLLNDLSGPYDNL